jgi:hypothetical protein
MAVGNTAMKAMPMEITVAKATISIPRAIGIVTIRIITVRVVVVVGIISVV